MILYFKGISHFSLYYLDTSTKFIRERCTASYASSIFGYSIEFDNENTGEIYRVEPEVDKTYYIGIRGCSSSGNGNIVILKVFTTDLSL
jgi:hypothetical protein